MGWDGMGAEIPRVGAGGGGEGLKFVSYGRCRYRRDAGDTGLGVRCRCWICV